jgi:hypothetical protein
MGLLSLHGGWKDYVSAIGAAWLALGLAGIAFRMVQLIVIQDVIASLAWFTKIATDPFHDIKLYWRAPLQLWRGELFAEAPHAQS